MTTNFQVKNKTTGAGFSRPPFLNSVLRVFGLSFTSRDHVELKFSHFIFRVAILLISLFILSALSVYQKLLYLKLSSDLFTLMNYFQLFFLFSYSQYILDIYFVYKYGRKSFSDYLCLYECLDKILGMNYCQEITRRINEEFVFFLMCGLIASVTDFVAWAINYGVVHQVVYSIEYLYFFLKLLTDLDFISNCNQVKYRVTEIRKKLQEFKDHTQNLLEDYNDGKNYEYKRNMSTLKKIDFVSSPSGRECQQDTVMQLNRCYLWLLEQCDYINNVFGYRMLFCNINYLINMLRVMCVTFGTLFNMMETDSSFASLPLVSEIMKMSANTVVVIYEVHRCEQNYKQTERILNLIDHILINKVIEPAVRDSLKELRNLIFTRPINFHAINFFKLDYKVLLSGAAIILTYTMTCLQNV